MTFLELYHLHPIVVHFPIALFVTAFGFDIACLVWRREAWLDRAALALYAFAALSGAAAVLTGKLAQASVKIASAEVRQWIEVHSDWAFFTLVAFVVVLVLRLEATWRDKRMPEIRPHRLRVLAVIIAFGTLWLLFETASRGASLVYDHGVAVHRAIP